MQFKSVSSGERNLVLLVEGVKSLVKQDGVKTVIRQYSVKRES